MQPYQALDRETGVTRFELGPDWIKIQFRGGSVYLYTYVTPGKSDVERMKKLALAGQGLSTYISRQVRDRFAAKLK